MFKVLLKLFPSVKSVFDDLQHLQRHFFFFLLPPSLEPLEWLSLSKESRLEREKQRNIADILKQFCYTLDLPSLLNFFKATWYDYVGVSRMFFRLQFMGIVQ